MRAPRGPRRRRSLTETLLSIVLGLEAVLVFFVTLAAFGLHALPPMTAFAGGAALVLVLLLAAAVQRHRWGNAVGWVLQAVIVATGILVPAMFVVGAIFAAMWVYCFVRGRDIDRTPSQPVESEQS